MSTTLRARNLRKSYKKRTVVKDVSIHVNAGEVVGLLGPNGAGKTTSFYMIVGLVAADASSGLATVTIPAALGGRHNFSFFPDGLWLGIALLVLAVVGSASVWRRTLPGW